MIRKRRLILLTKKEYVRRYVYFVVGIFILSFGIALSTRADLGVSPVSSIPYALSFSLPFSMGQITIVIQLIYLIIEFIILGKKNFNPINILQIGVVVLFGYFNDFSLMLVSGIQAEHYPVQWIICVVSMFLIALGVNIEVRAGVQRQQIKEDSAGSGAENGGERALYHHRTSGQLLSGTSAGMFPCIYPWGVLILT